MREFLYKIEGNEYVLYCDDEVIVRTPYSISLCIAKSIDNNNKIECILHKHGRHENVQAFYEKAKPLEDIFGSILLLKGRFPVSEINKLINNTGYATKFYENFVEGKMEVESSIHPDIDEMNGYDI
jgi:hypothetical protein